MYLFGFYISPVTAIGALLILLLSFLMKSKSKKYNHPPGPWPLPIVGNLLMFFREPDIMKSFNQLKIKYGPIYKLKFGIHDIVVVSNTQLAIEALVKKQVDFAGRPNIPTLEKFSEGGKNIVFGNYNSEWHARRKLAHKAIKLFLSERNLDEKVNISVEKVLENMSQIKHPFEPHHHNDLMVFNIVADICHGTRFELDDPEFTKIVKINEDFLELYGNGLASDYIPWMKIFETSAFKNIMSYFEILRNDAQAILDRHKKDFDPDKPRDITDYLLAAKHKAKEEGNTELLNQLTDIHLRQIILDFIFAGTFTSSTTITWIILLVLRHPKVQVKMHEEIDSVIGQVKMTSAMKEKFPYCTAVIREAMRICPVAPVGVPRATTCDTTLGGYDIPKDVQVIFNIFDLHHDPLEWENPSEFIPERFLTESGELAPKPEAFLPFMAGRRVCLGEAIAKLEMLLIVVAIFQRFQISSPSGEIPSVDGYLSAIGYMPPKYNILLEERF